MTDLCPDRWFTLARIVLVRLPQLVITLLVVSVVVFTVVRLAPGDPVAYQIGGGAGFTVSDEALANVRAEMGLDKPVPVQYAIWLGNVLTGDLGQSFRNKRPVLDLIAEKLPASLELMLASLLVGLVVGIPAGCLAAVKRGSWVDSLVSFIVLIGMAIPMFWLGLLFIMFFSLQLRILPASGFTPILVDPLANLRQLAMPALSIGLNQIALYARYSRSEMLNALSQDYVRTAHAKGLSLGFVLRRHALPNALIPVITVLGLQIGTLISGTAVVEQVYGWSGVGWLVVESIQNRDYPVVQGVVLLSAVAFCLANLAVDVAYTIVNPRIRYQ